MKFILLSFVLFIISTQVTVAQIPATPEEDNYKHSNTFHHRHSNILREDTISLRDQKTQKSQSRTYIVAPSDSLPNRNVQGKKTKANYKNQFN
ncbi:hypothetical protein [Cytophaga aurantiaca]|uniref:hypothetical protein n=1 Tax=Cytophaga aurantiaca TaxID=29530 RepID=UPI00037F0080|nr:hypothetical protein [Cytophaga aurantiaca]